MEGYGTVQQKISCVFETQILDEQSTKRENQSYRVVATDNLKQRAIDSDIYNAVPTEKLDGTCVYIAKFEDKPWLWARFDRRPTKGAERKFKKFQQQKMRQKGGDDSKFTWDMEKDFKDTPAYWIPASCVQTVNGAPQPDDIGHTPGWIPVSSGARQYCWHMSAVDLNTGTALVLREMDQSDHLKLVLVPLSELEGHTAELIGTNINGNPYGLGSKKLPLHVLVVHGSLRIRNPPQITASAVKEWFNSEGQVEGIVWHCTNKTLFKVHRNHVALPWPVENPNLSKRSVEILVDCSVCGSDDDGEVLQENPVITSLGKLYGHMCDSVRDLENLMINETCDENGQKSEQSVEKMCSDVEKIAVNS